MVYDMMIRKKALKIQERLGMRIGLPYGTAKLPSVRTVKDIAATFDVLYRIGMRAFVLPRELFSNIQSTTDLYKTHYGTLLKIRDLARKYNIELSLHHSALSEHPDEELKTFASIASVMDARILVIHPNFYSRVLPKDQALRLVGHKISEISGNIRTKTPIGIETTGRSGEVGSVEDVLDLVTSTPGTEPVLNWAHIHARGQGLLKDQTRWRAVTEQVLRRGGRKWLNNAYFFFSGISYNQQGEVKHVPLANADLRLDMLVREVMSHDIKGTLILEDPDRDKFFVNILEQLADMVR